MRTNVVHTLPPGGMGYPTSSIRTNIVHTLPPPWVGVSNVVHPTPSIPGWGYPTPSIRTNIVHTLPPGGVPGGGVGVSNVVHPTSSIRTNIVHTLPPGSRVGISNQRRPYVQRRPYTTPGGGGGGRGCTLAGGIQRRPSNAVHTYQRRPYTTPGGGMWGVWVSNVVHPTPSIRTPGG